LAQRFGGNGLIDRNCQETGYLGYIRKSRRGLANQGWKDSGDCIVNRKGHMATGPITLCEVQAYYAAKVRLAEIARMKKKELTWQTSGKRKRENSNSVLIETFGCKIRIIAL
jgi:glycogen debranching enzyme